MENFRHPYRAVSIQDFWKRWHISLTRWFTDYVYIPLGGKPQRICEEMPECADRFLVEWILAWRVLEFCCVGTDPWNLYGCGYVLLADKER